MTAVTLRGRVVSTIAATVALFGAGTASSADFDLEREAYKEELNRCIDLLRPTLQMGDVGKVTYDVQEIDLRGPWYQFELAVSVEGASGLVQLDEYKVGCKSNRWIDSSQLQVRRNTQQLLQQAELLASD